MEAIRNDFKDYRYVVTIEFDAPNSNHKEYSLYKGSSSIALVRYIGCCSSHPCTRIIRVYYRGVIQSVIHAIPTP